MTEKELTDLRVQLYKATPLKLQLADELKHLIEEFFSKHIGTLVSRLQIFNTLVRCMNTITLIDKDEGYVLF